MISETKKVAEKKNIVLENKLHNRFDIEVRDARTGEVRQKAQAFNIILDQFWTRLFAGQSVYDYIQYGSGQGTPSTADTALFNWVGGAGASAAIYDDAHYAEGWNSFTRSIVLDEQTAVGVTLTEVGIAGASNSALCTHAMLRDMNGNPISIQKTDTDIITIYATVYIHWNVNGSNGVKYIPSSHWFGTTFGSIRFGFGKALAANLWQHNLSGFTADALNKRWVADTIRIGVGQANWNGLGYGMLSNYISYSEVGIFTIDLTESYSITGEPIGTGDGTTTEFNTAFDLPSDVTIYVDGVAQTSGITVAPFIHRAFSLELFDHLDMQSSPQLPIPTTKTNPESVYYNRYYETHPITSIRCWENGQGTGRASAIYVSNDMETWEFLVQRQVLPYQVPAQYQHFKYWREVPLTGPGWFVISSNAAPTSAIVFDTPPAAGAVITADYKTPFVPKDENHVYDFSVTVSLGEYSEP